MEWTREERYRKINEVSEEEIKKLKERVDRCQYRQKFHIQPKTGLLNDPNGFSYFNGEYHLFYQWFPLGPVHGLKHWYHLSSKDLVNFKDCGVGIIPEEYYESHGAFSGSGIVKGNKLYLFYTGNVRNENWERQSYQCLATMNENGEIIKNRKPVIDKIPEGYTDHFRDPKVFKINDMYYCIIGAQRKEGLIGTVVYYESKDLIEWTFKGEIKTSFVGNGFMWECPDYLNFGEKSVLIISPQGLQADGDKYRNIYQSGYLVGNNIDFQNGVFEHGDFNELDRGFDFYAPQTTKDDSGRYILFGWMGLPEIEYPSDEHGWAHCLTLPREITIKGDKLIQKPIKELEKLREEERVVKYNINNDEVDVNNFNEETYEMICTFKNINGGFVGINMKKGNNNKTTFYYDILNKKFVFNRSKSGVSFAEEYVTERKCQGSDNYNEVKLQIFVDISSIEIFVNNGEEVFTSRIFTDIKNTGLSFFSEGSSEVEASIWKIK